MDISKTNAGASTYAMKKAMEMPNLMLQLVQQTAGSGQAPLKTDSSAELQKPNTGAVNGKGGIIDIVA